MSDQQEFLLEKYKYILSRKKDLNEATFKIVAIYQAAIAAAALAQFNIITLANTKSMIEVMGRVATTLVFLFIVISTFTSVALILGGILSWLKYRRDESHIEDHIYGELRRATPPSNIFTWYETYIMLVILLFFVAATMAYFRYIFPLVGGFQI